MKSVLIGIFFLLPFFQINAHTIPVGTKFPTKGIKQALAIAKDGDTVVVHSGTYREGNITIDKKIVFLGVDRPTLDGQFKSEVLSVKADSVVVKGFRVVHSSVASLEDPCGIKIYNRKFVRIEDNHLEDNFFGIYIQNGSNCVVKNNIIIAHGVEEQSIGNGIHCWKSSDLQIIGNQIRGHRDGIYFEFVTQSVIWRNISVQNIRYGLHFMFSNDDAYISNIFKNNGAGVVVMFSKKIKMYNNTFEENWGDSAYGLLLKEISDGYIFNNHFIKNTTAIYLEGASRIKMEKNIFEANGWAMKIQANSVDNELVSNNFLGNTFDISTNGSLVLNTFNSNYWDKYEGYDLDKNGVGDVPYHPLSLFAVLTEKNPAAMILFRSFMITLLDKSEKVLPSITPDNFIDNTPLMKSLLL